MYGVPRWARKNLSHISGSGGEELTFAQDYVVELDIVMDADTPLWKAHDLSQALQDKIEQLPNVGRGT